MTPHFNVIRIRKDRVIGNRLTPQGRTDTCTDPTKIRSVLVLLTLLLSLETLSLSRLEEIKGMSPVGVPTRGRLC